MGFVKFVELDLSHFDKPIEDVLCLDFDGVLHPEGAARDREMASVPILMRALEEADPEERIPIVISSYWRIDHNLDALRGFLGRALARRVIGVTPDYMEFDGAGVGAHRQREIERWMMNHAPLGQWRAIDDKAEYFEPNCSNLVLTNAKKGLVPMDEERVVRAISEMTAERLRRRFRS